MEADVARLTEKTEAHGLELREIRAVLQKNDTTCAKLDLILYRLDEQKQALTNHDAAETARHAAHEARITALELRKSEQKGMWKVAAAIGSVFGAGAAAAIEHYLLGGKP